MFYLQQMRYETVPNLGQSPHGILMQLQLREKIDKLNDAQNRVFCPITQNFLLVGPTVSANNFSATMAST